jgi:hypothetical protein
MDARPSTLDIIATSLAEWLKAADGASADSPTAASPLARVRALALRLGGTPPEAAFMARLMRAAPQLRQLTFYVMDRVHALRVLSEESACEPAWAGLVHPRLRRIVVISLFRQTHSLASRDCSVPLRQRHFPRLRRLTVDGEEFPV